MCARRHHTNFGRRASLRPVSALAFGVLCAMPAAAAAADALELTLSAPLECGSADQVRSAVAELLHQSPAEPLRASLTIRHTEAGYAAELRTHSTTLREIAAPSCEAVIEAATVILALAIDPSAGARSQAPARAPGETQATRAEASLARIVLRAGASETFDSSTLPHVTAGARLRAGVSAREWSALAEFTIWLPATAWISQEPPLGGRFTWWTAGVSGCFSPVSARGFGLCLAPELGRLEGTGLGVSQSTPAPATWFSISLAPELAVPLNSSVSFRASLGVAVTVVGRHPFVLEGSGDAAQVHQPGRVSGRASIGLDVAF